MTRGDDVTADLTGVLVRSLRALGDAGRPVQASRLAARAWWVLREDWPRHAEHVNGAMHYLARLPPEIAVAGGDAGIEAPGSSEERKDLP